MSDSYELEQKLFADAVARPASERGRWLEEACGGDAELRRRVAALLREHESVGGALDMPPEEELAEAIEAARAAGADTERAGTTIGRYTLIEKIGEGGCGIVYRAEQREPVRRQVALKIIKLGMDTREVIARFETERQALALMDHANIARVFDAGATETGRPYFVMELVEGVAITKFCDEARLPLAARLELFVTVCHAIQHAHQRGIIHRDIKPSNVLVGGADGRPGAKVIDFGVAKAIETRLGERTFATAFAHFIGTPAYVSPEQAELVPGGADTRSDIYSLGVLLYELLAGATPFDAKELARGGIEAMRRRIREEEPPRPSARFAALEAETRAKVAHDRQCEPAKLKGWLGGELDWIAMRCLEKDRARRYDTARDLALDVERHRRHEPVTARPPTQGYVLRKFVRRQRVALVAVGALAVALMSGAVAFTVVAMRERAAAERVAVLRQAAYGATLELAQRALRAGETGRARDILETAVPATGEADGRGFEWRALWREARGDPADVLQVAGGDPQVVQKLSVSPDGKWIAGLNRAGQIVLWEAATKARARTIAGVSQLGGFSADGKWIVGSDARFALQRWSVATGAAEARPVEMRGRAFAVLGADGVAVFEGGGNTGRPAGVRWWDFALNREVGAYTPPAEDGVPWVPARAAVSGDGTRLALALGRWPKTGGRFQIVALKTGEVEFDEPRSFTALSFSPDGSRLACGDADARDVSVLDLATHRWLWRQPVGIGRGNNAGAMLAFSADGSRLLVGMENSGIGVLDAATGADGGTLRGHAGLAHSLAATPEGDGLVSSDNGGMVLAWRGPLRPLGPELRGFRADALGRHRVSIATDGAWVAGVLPGKGVRVIDRGTRGVRAELRDAEFSLGSTGDGRGIWVVASGNRFQEWNLEAAAPRLVREWPLLAEHGAFSAAGFSADRRLMVAGDVKGWLQLWDVAAGRVLFEGTGHAGMVMWGVVTTDGTRAITTGNDNTIKVWRLPSGALEKQIECHPYPTYAGLSRDGRWLAFGYYNGDVEIRRPDTLEVVRRLQVGGHDLHAIAFIDQDRRLVCSGLAGALEVYDTADWRHVGTLVTNQDLGRPAGWLDWSEEAGVLTAMFADGRMRIWDVGR